MKFYSKSQKGQTLIETMVAAMILVLGIGAAVGLAIFALQATSTSSNQLIAIGLAREGIEAVKNMRDTNWLQSDPASTCYDFYTDTNGAYCHQDWLNDRYNIDPGVNSTQSYFLGLNYSSTNVAPWTLTSPSSKPTYGLNYDPNATAGGFYTPGTGVAVSEASSKFGRKVIISRAGGEFFPFDASTGIGPRLKVEVIVWWSDRRCNVEDDLVRGQSNCSVALTTYLTNWKNY